MRVHIFVHKILIICKLLRTHLHSKEKKIKYSLRNVVEKVFKNAGFEKMLDYS